MRFCIDTLDILYNRSENPDLRPRPRRPRLHPRHSVPQETRANCPRCRWIGRNMKTRRSMSVQQLSRLGAKGLFKIEIN